MPSNADAHDDDPWRDVRQDVVLAHFPAVVIVCTDRGQHPKAITATVLHWVPPGIGRGDGEVLEGFAFKRRRGQAPLPDPLPPLPPGPIPYRLGNSTGYLTEPYCHYCPRLPKWSPEDTRKRVSKAVAAGLTELDMSWFD
ncbi:hypothetical protein [Cellulomonas alba]|uniref:Uncharacterized protein n=1 Tax=Cellulomonas alba TaxID=3053467 RepID=A0ABT7SKB6_9CELL|nr:hypothetical protein [Cellulomonas alba]MDM7856632.1 hypothetical protein [Cellulomonas alba]